MKSLVAAVGFLTIFPIPRSIHEDPRALGKSVWWFPAVGIIVGAALAALDLIFGLAFPAGVRAALTVLSLVVLSRSLHMDGLADTADGLLSFRPREKMLEIMRDPRCGPMGVVAVAGVLALKTAAIFSLPGAGRWKTLLLLPVAGRCAMGLVMGLYRYARPEGGLATAFQNRYGLWMAVWSVIWIIPSAVVARGPKGLVIGAACACFVWLLGSCISRRIGGYTGDTLGATCELAEVVWLLLLSARLTAF